MITYNLTNVVYADLIQQLLKQYFTSFEEVLVPRSDGELMAINMSADEQTIDLLMKRIGIDFDCLMDTGTGSGSTRCKFLRIEQVLINIFKLYNIDKDVLGKNEEKKELSEEIRWLSETIWSIESKHIEAEYSNVIHLLAIQIFFKVYFDTGLNFLTTKSSTRLGNEVPLKWLRGSLTNHSADAGS